MKVAIFCGGLGTRLREETEFRPKPMVEIGGKPILWHLMRHYARFGFCEFVLLLGYRGNVIREYFANYLLMNSDVRVHIGTQTLEYLGSLHEEAAWVVTLVETGVASNTGERLRRARRYLGESSFMCTYGDGISSVDLHALLEFHRSRGRIATATVVHPGSRFGEIEQEQGIATSFQEKPQLSTWVNGGFFVMEPAVFEYIEPDESLEPEPFRRLAAAGQLAAFEHEGYWASMDTYRDVQNLNAEWDAGRPGWLETA